MKYFIQIKEIGKFIALFTIYIKTYATTFVPVVVHIPAEITLLIVVPLASFNVFVPPIVCVATLKVPASLGSAAILNTNDALADPLA